MNSLRIVAYIACFIFHLVLYLTFIKLELNSSGENVCQDAIKMHNSREHYALY